MLTKDEILNMPAGREMDAIIFAKVFEKMAFRVPENDPWIFTDEREYLDAGDAYYLNERQAPVRLPCYSTDPAAEREVIDELQRRNLWVHVSWLSSYVRCVITNPKAGVEAQVEVKAETGGLAVCRAALLAVTA